MENPDAQLIEDLSRKVHDFVRKQVPAGTVAVVDFPQHENVGDSAIWCGEVAVLDRARWPRAYVAERRYHNDDEMNRCIGDGTILLHGGGNLGDLWPHHQQFREAIIDRHSSTKIVQLPQTAFFRDERAQQAAAVALSRHRDLTIAARDHRSFDLLQSMGLRSALVPDAAFCLGPIDRPQPRSPGSRVLWLGRTDHESLIATKDYPGVTVNDWLRRAKPPLSEPGARALFYLTAALHRCRHHGRGRVPVSVPLAVCFNTAAQRRVLRGLHLLGSADVVVTDRLHGHILCLLLGIPHVVLPDRYGKLANFWHTWTSGSRLATWCDTPAEAYATSLRLCHELGLRIPHGPRGGVPTLEGSKQ